MTRDPKISSQNQTVGGASFSDFSLKDELTKPWMTIHAFCTRYRRSRWSFASFGRFLLCLTISICVVLQGLAVNTIAIPKARWWPSEEENGYTVDARRRESLTIFHPKPYLKDINWFNHLGVGKENVGSEGYHPWDWALGVSGALSFSGLFNVVATCNSTGKGWRTVHRTGWESPIRWTGLYTQFNNASMPVETLSIGDWQVWNIFNNNRPSQAAKATGWNGYPKLMVPVLSTHCESAASSSPAVSDSINVILPSGGRSTFAITYGPIPAANFSGASCSTNFSQALFPPGIWIVGLGGVALDLSGSWDDWMHKLDYQPPTPYDHNITINLAIQARDTFPRMTHLIHDTSLSYKLLLMSRVLQTLPTANISSDAHGLAVITGVYLQNLVAAATQSYETSLPGQEEEFVSSYPNRWQIYGSGPRMSWSWVAVLILIVVVSCFCFGIWQTWRYWTVPGEWLELGGMMVVAQASRPVTDIADKKKTRQKMYWVEEKQRSSGWLEVELGSRDG